MNAGYVAVCGGTDPSSVEIDWARKTAQQMAQWGIVLVCGEPDLVSRAAVAGMRSNGGTTIGLLPDKRKSPPRGFSFTIPTGLGERSRQILAQSADVLLVVGGGWSLIPEVAFSLRLGRPVVALSTPLKKVKTQSRPIIYHTHTPEDAFWQIHKLLGLGRR